MNKRHRVPAPVAVVIGIVVVIFGLFNLFSNWNYINENEQFRHNAEKVVAECTMAGDGTDSSQSYRKSTVEFFYNGKKYKNVVIDNYGQLILPGNNVELYVNTNNPTQCVIEYKTNEGIGETYTLFTVGGLVAGAIMIIVGISRIKRGAIW
ncbi:MAG: DUF3592 domain-containing protein [Clostridia bacterium]|nr:DUF3592 domain-containing protein [Clostridia bacterium]